MQKKWECISALSCWDKQKCHHHWGIFVKKVWGNFGQYFAHDEKKKNKGKTVRIYRLIQTKDF